MMEMRPWQTKAIQELGAARSVEMPHRENIARIADRYGLGTRLDGASGQRRWSEREAVALVRVCELRSLGLEWNLIDRLVRQTVDPESLMTTLTNALEEIEKAQPSAA
jgi:hypothetical protein